jgi:hypothetical protein
MSAENPKAKRVPVTVTFDGDEAVLIYDLVRKLTQNQQTGSIERQLLHDFERRLQESTNDRFDSTTSVDLNESRASYFSRCMSTAVEADAFVEECGIDLKSCTHCGDLLFSDSRDFSVESCSRACSAWSELTRELREQEGIQKQVSFGIAGYEGMPDPNEPFPFDREIKVLTETINMFETRRSHGLPQKHSVLQRYEWQARAWNAAGRPNEMLLQDEQLCALKLWCHTESKVRPIPAIVDLYLRVSDSEAPENWYMAFMNEHSACRLCGVGFRMENLSVCTQGHGHHYCWCVSNLREAKKLPNGNLQCPLCPGELVG